MCTNSVFHVHYQCKNSQAVKNGVALKSLGGKSCEIKGGSQEMTTNIFIAKSL